MVTRLGQCALLIAVACACASAADVAVLSNGFSIRHDHRQVRGDVTRLYIGADNSSFVDVPTGEIDHFESDSLPVTPPVAATASPSPAPAPATAAPASPPPAASALPALTRPASLSELVSSAGDRHQLDPDLISSVIHAESDFNARAISPKGALGLMQLMPKTASQLGVANVFNPSDNVDGGSKYLRELMERYGFDLKKALAAYNAGPQRVEQYGGVPPYYETQAYVARVIREFNRRKLAEQKAARKTAQAGHPASSAGRPGSARPSRAVAAKSSNPPGSTQQASR